MSSFKVLSLKVLKCVLCINQTHIYYSISFIVACVSSYTNETFRLKKIYT